MKRIYILILLTFVTKMITCSSDSDLNAKAFEILNSYSSKSSCQKIDINDFKKVLDTELKLNLDEDLKITQLPKELIKLILKYFYEDQIQIDLSALNNLNGVFIGTKWEIAPTEAQLKYMKEGRSMVWPPTYTKLQQDLIFSGEYKPISEDPLTIIYDECSKLILPNKIIFNEKQYNLVNIRVVQYIKVPNIEYATLYQIPPAYKTKLDLALEEDNKDTVRYQILKLWECSQLRKENFCHKYIVEEFSTKKEARKFLGNRDGFINVSDREKILRNGISIDSVKRIFVITICPLIY